jgi:hypothetical protein
MCRFLSWKAVRISALLVIIGFVALPSARPDIIGFNGGKNFTVNDLGTPADITGDVLTITQNTNGETHSVWYNDPQKVTTFAAQFTFQLDPMSDDPTADGVTFTIQNDPTGTAAIGGGGGCVGWCGINPGAAVGLNVWPDHPLGTSLAKNGVAFDRTWISLICAGGGGIDLHSHNPIQVNLKYDGTTLTETVTDTVTSVSTTLTYPLDVSAAGSGIVDVNGKAIVGFTGATGGAHSFQKISGFTFTEGP